MVTFCEVRKTSEASKYVCYWREVGGVKAANGVNFNTLGCLQSNSPLKPDVVITYSHAQSWKRDRGSMRASIH